MDIQLGLNLEQNLILTQQMRQSLEILQLNSAQLDEYIENAILDNPVIERSEKKTSSYGGEVSPDVPDTRGISLREHLLDELLSADIRKELLVPAQAIIERIDDDGYLNIPKSVLAKELRLSIDELKEIFRAIYRMEPAGVGAYDLRQCLELQLQAKGKLTRFASTMLRECLDDILANRLRTAADKTGADIADIQMLADEIRRLDPKPGRAYSAYYDNRYIVVDVVIKEEEGRFNVYLNDPQGTEIHVNEEYERMYRENKGNPEIAEYLKNRIGEAVLLAKAIEQRKKTIISVATVIADEQEAFLRNGSLYMKPLNYDMVAEKIGVHKSTISRTVKEKYAQTPQGIMPLRSFFGSGIGDSAALSIKGMIKEIIGSEDKRRPLSDQFIADILNSQNVEISRRTVTKYRESIGIPESRKRRRFDSH